MLSFCRCRPRYRRQQKILREKILKNARMQMGLLDQMLSYLPTRSTDLVVNAQPNQLIDAGISWDYSQGFLFHQTGFFPTHDLFGPFIRPRTYLTAFNRFFDLPREIRDEIYANTILLSQSPQHDL